MEPTSLNHPSQVRTDYLLFESRPGVAAAILPDAPRFTVVAVTHDFLTSVGMKKEDIVGRGHFEPFPESPEDGEFTGENNIRAAFEYVIQHKKPYELPVQRYDIPNGDGTFTERYWKAYGSPVLNESGELLYIIHAPVEVTEQVKAEKSEQAHQELRKAYQKLEESEKKYRSLFESIDQGFCVVEVIYNESGVPVDHLIIETNPVFETQTGLKGVAGKTAREVAPGIETRWFQLYDNVVHSGKPERFTEESIALNRWFDVYVYPASYAESKRVAVLFTDITDRKKMELALKENETQLQKKIQERTAELEKANQELKRSNINLEEFAYAASHDMKEPIRKIHFFAERLKSRLLHKMEEEDLRYFERLETGAIRMSTLIDDLLLYSHVNRGVSTIETVDLNKMLSFVMDDLELHISEKGAKIEIGSLPTIQGRPRQLQQVLENLIANALKYSKEGVIPLIRVSARLINGTELSIHSSVVKTDKMYHLIEVVDNGIGFDQKDAERIFNVFTRLHGNAEYRGTGVGLSIVQKIVENHDGYIWAESKPYEGATFFILLPTE